MENYSESIQNILSNMTTYLPLILKAIAVLIIGLWVIKKIMRVVQTALSKSGISADIQPFLVSIISVLLKVLLVFTVAEIVGIETTSFVAILAAAGFAVGMALQGSLSNFAAGVMILIFKPYRVNDMVSLQDQMGRVQEIQIFNTLISTLDNKTVIVPNGQAISDVIENLSSKEKLRVDMNVHVPYAEDFPKIKKIITEAVAATPKVLAEPIPFVGIEAFDSHNVVLTVRPYANTEDYWDVYFACMENIKNVLSKNNVKVAYSEGVELGDIGL